MDQQPYQQPPQQAPMPVTTMPESSQPLQPAAKKTPWMVIIVLLGVLVIGSYAGAAFYFKIWPFQGMGPASKQSAFANFFSKIQSINSATYEAKFGLQAEPREAGATAFEPLTFPEFVNDTQMYERDANRVSDAQSIQSALSVYRQSNTAYPNQLSDVPALTAKNLSDFTYALNAGNDDYALSVTFETDDAVKAVAGYSKKEVTQVDGKKVTLSKKSESYFYFNGEPHRPSWVSTLEQGADEYLDYAPSDFSFNLRAGGTSTKDQAKKADANFHLGGDASFGDFNVAAEFELRKKGDTYYGMVSKFPSLFIDLTAIKNKWIKAVPEDLVGYSDLSYIGTFIGDKQQKNTQALEQFQTILKTMDEDKVLQVDMSLPDESLGTTQAYAYNVTYDETKVAAWYEHLSKELQDKFGADAMVKLDETSLRYMKTDTFTKYLTFIKNNTKLKILIDKNTGYPVQMSYRFRIVPGAKATKLKDKQIGLDLTLSLSNINVPVVVEEPAGAISFEDAQLALTGMTKEMYRAQRQQTNVDLVRSALSEFKSYTGAYPASLDELTTPRGKLTKAPKKTVTNTNATGVQIDFPDSFNSFNDPEYEKQLAETPFLKTVPQDGFTGQQFIYEKLTNPDAYTLKYTMQIPHRVKEQASNGGGGFMGMSNGFGVNEAVNYVNGVNTANATEISVEAKVALAVDTDADGLPDIVEAYYGSDPNKKDSDGDGYSDGDEVTKGYEPAGPGKLDYYDVWYPPRNLGAETSAGVGNQLYNTSVASAKSTANALVSALTVCQLKGGSIQADQGTNCSGKELPAVGKKICTIDEPATQATWPALPYRFDYTFCAGDTKAKSFSYNVFGVNTFANGPVQPSCSITCTQTGCTSIGC